MSKILAFGDSITYGKWDSLGGWAERLRTYVDKKYNRGANIENKQVYNLGIPGEVSVRMAERFEVELDMRITKSEIDPENIIIIAIGANDANPVNWMTQKQTSENNFKQALVSMIGNARKLKTQIFLVGLAPLNVSQLYEFVPDWTDKFDQSDIQKFDQFVKDVAESESVEYIEMFEYLMKHGIESKMVDGIHPNDEGHELMFKRIVSKIGVYHR